MCGEIRGRTKYYLGKAAANICTTQDFTQKGLFQKMYSVYFLIGSTFVKIQSWETL